MQYNSKRNKKLVKNTALFFLSNFGSKILSFFLVPFYTSVLSKEEYGTIDIVVITSSLLLPIITACIYDGVVRFSMDKDYSLNDVYSSGLFVSIFGNIFFLGITFLITKMLSVSDFYIFLIFILIFDSINAINNSFCRGIGKTKEFAFSGLLQTAVFIISNIILLLVFKKGIEGYLLSLVLSYFFPSIYTFLRAKLYNYLKIKINTITCKKMILYTLPLIPNTLFWWVMNASDKYVISIFLNVSYNGLYAIANKLPSIINLFNIIFFQAWQLSAIEEADSSDKGAYYSTTFDYLSTLIFLITSMLIVLLKPIFSVWVAKDYYSAIYSTPILFVSVIFMCFSSFWGTNYVVLKKSKEVMWSAGAGALVNLVLNFILIPTINLYGAALATAIGFFVTWIIRYFDINKYIKIKIKMFKVLLSIVLIIFQYVFMLVINNTYVAFVIQLLLFSLILLVNRKQLHALVLTFWSYFLNIIKVRQK